MLQKYLIRVRNYVFNILYNILFPDHSGSTSTSQSKPSEKLLSPSKSLYRHVADLWQTWLPPKAVDSLQKGKCLKTNSLSDNYVTHLLRLKPPKYINGFFLWVKISAAVQKQRFKTGLFSHIRIQIYRNCFSYPFVQINSCENHVISRQW